MLSLLLPLDAKAFQAPASAIQKGCEAALSLSGGGIRLDIARTSADPGTITAAWTAAAERGATVIIGPLTRDAVSALASQLARSPLNRVSFPASATLQTIPRPPVTIALNAPEEAGALPLRFYTFGLLMEQEARAVARMAWADKARTAYVVQATHALARRTSQAFAVEWQALGGQIIDAEDIDPSGDTAAEAGGLAGRLRSRLARGEVDMVFLSADGAEARRVRPYLGSSVAVYATSMVNDGRQDAGANVDLIGIRFVDMPWMMQADHPAVMVYPRPDYPGPELQRFHALGIDACRMAEALLQGRNRIELDGVTGRLQLTTPADGSGAAIQREPVMAIFADPAARPPSDAGPNPP